MRGGVEIAVVHQGFDRKVHRTGAGTNDVIADKCGVGSLLHPDALFNNGIGAGKRPHRRGSLQTEIANQAESLGADGTVVPAIGAERIRSAVVLYDFIEFGNQQGAADGRI